MDNDIYFDNPHKYKFLNQYAKLTNIESPRFGYVTKDKFPEQQEEFLRQNITIRFTKEFEFEYSSNGERTLSVYKENCILVRYDKESPSIAIAVSINSGRVYILNSGLITSENDIIYKYPTQQTRYLNLATVGMDSINKDTYNGTIIRCDDAEPSYAIVMEYLENKIIRFVTSDEIRFRIVNYNTSHESSLNNIKELLTTALEENKIYGEPNYNKEG